MGWSETFLQLASLAYNYYSCWMHHTQNIDWYKRPSTMSDAASLINESSILKRLDLSAKLVIIILFTSASNAIASLHLLTFSNTVRAESKKRVHIR